ncbi:MAG: metallophosphoesterase [Kofleriaceae bacterium]
MSRWSHVGTSVALLAAVAVAGGAGCERRARPAGAPRGPEAAEVAPSASASPAAPTRAASDAAAASPCALAELPLRRPAARRVVAIGDLHGDARALLAALEVAGALDARGRWSGGELVVVQTGDLLDRGDDEQELLDTLERLEGEARAAGGALIWLLGNHELMNAAGDFRYVTPGGFVDFQDAPGVEPSAAAGAPEVARARLAAFAVGPHPGPYARILAGQNTVQLVGDVVFSHAGPLGEWAARADELNREARCWLSGQVPATALPAALTAEEGPAWTRALGLDPVDCARVREALTALGAKRMVVGHTVQPSGISSACDGAVWRIDVGLGAAYGGPIEVLELTEAGPRVLRGVRRR